MKKVLLQDIVIPAGTVFDTAPDKTTRAEGHFSHVIGLTNDTSGDLTYYIDPDDPEMKEWFGEEGEEFPAKASNVILINNKATTLSIPPERVLEAAKGILKRVVILGTEKGEDGMFYFCSSTSNKKECLWLVDNFKNQLLNGFKDLTDEGFEVDTEEAELVDEVLVEAVKDSNATIIGLKDKFAKPVKTAPKYRLTIAPAIGSEDRHMIQDSLTALGFIITGTGEDVNGSSCDISFDDYSKEEK